MEKDLKFKSLFLDRLSELSAEHTQRKDKKDEEGAFDEAIFEKIKLNVIQIFRQMFEISFKIVSEKSRGPMPRLEEILSNYSEKNWQLYHVYQFYFHMIPQNWQSNCQTARAHQNEEEAIKEEIKLAMVAEIRSIFENMFVNFYNIPEKESS